MWHKSMYGLWCICTYRRHMTHNIHTHSSKKGGTASKYMSFIECVCVFSLPTGLCVCTAHNSNTAHLDYNIIVIPHTARMTDPHHVSVLQCYAPYLTHIHRQKNLISRVNNSACISFTVLRPFSYTLVTGRGIYHTTEPWCMFVLNCYTLFLTLIFTIPLDRVA